MNILEYTMNRLITVKTYRLEKSAAIILRGTLYSLAFACFTGIMTKLRFYLPFTPVPFTGQVFAVLLSGLLLGKIFGPLSQIFYITLGISGLHWFALGPFSITGGYIAGFVVASFIIGLITDNVAKLNLIKSILSMLSGILAIYTLGLIQFLFYTGKPVVEGIKLAVLPFIPFDLIKMALVIGLGNLLFKKKKTIKT